MKKYDIPNCKYYVTDEGRLFNKITNEEFIPTPKKSGYIEIKFDKKNHKLHRIVAEAFIPNPDNKPEVDHINRNKSDNRVSNLRWATRKEQCNNRKDNLPEDERLIDSEHLREYHRKYDNEKYKTDPEFRKLKIERAIEYRRKLSHK